MRFIASNIKSILKNNRSYPHCKGLNFFCVRCLRNNNKFSPCTGLLNHIFWYVEKDNAQLRSILNFQIGYVKLEKIALKSSSSDVIT